MLGILTKSAIRRKIIILFVYNQRKEFYLSEIARLVKTTPGTAQRELNRLLSQDFIAFRKKGNLNLYKLNPGYSLLKEIEVIVRKTFGAEVELKKELGKVKGISFAFLFGSYAKGSLKSDSDIDLFIVGDPVDDDVYRAVRRVEEIVGREINYHLAGEVEFAQKSKTRSFLKDVVARPMMIVGKEDELRQRLI
jgi:predicted nucleotidyltransferase